MAKQLTIRSDSNQPRWNGINKERWNKEELKQNKEGKKKQKKNCNQMEILKEERLIYSAGGGIRAWFTCRPP